MMGEHWGPPDIALVHDHTLPICPRCKTPPARAHRRMMTFSVTVNGVPVTVDALMRWDDEQRVWTNVEPITLVPPIRTP